MTVFSSKYQIELISFKSSIGAEKEKREKIKIIDSSRRFCCCCTRNILDSSLFVENGSASASFMFQDHSESSSVADVKRIVLNIVATDSCDKDQSITSLPKVVNTKPADDEDHTTLSPLVVELNPLINHQIQVVVLSNDDSEIYAQIDSTTTASFNYEDNNTEQTYSIFNQFSFEHQLSLQRSAASVPFLLDLREHLWH